MADLQPNSTFGIYHIVRPIGGGGMARIYLAKTQGLAGFEKYLALKVINAEYANENRFIQMLIDEAKITVSLSHANIAQIFDLGEVDGIYYIAMEYVDGVDVLRLVNGLHRQNRKVPFEAAAFISKQVCAGLDYAHSRTDGDGKPLNLVHRDISPQNILVSCNGEVKIVDFGIAKAAGVSTKTQAGVVKGKVNYMAPEQVMGHDADRRSDVFSLGIVTWEMLTSQMVYSTENVADLVTLVRKADIKRPSGVRKEIPKQLDDIVMKALAPKSKSRYQSAHELQVDLAKFLSAKSPDYSASAVAELVESVLAEEKGSGFDRTMRFSKADGLSDEHSLIFDGDASGEGQLVIEHEGHRQVIQLGRSLVIGRAGELVLTDARVSRRHVRIYRTGDIFMVEDLGSSNGSYLNSERLTASKVLRHGDEVRLGNTRLVFLAGGKGEGAAAELPGGEKPTQLIIEKSGQRLVKILEEDVTELSYMVQIGPTSLQGKVATIRKKKDGLWLEPSGHRFTLLHNGSMASQPTMLNLGDNLQIGTMVCKLTQ